MSLLMYCRHFHVSVLQKTGRPGKKWTAFLKSACKNYNKNTVLVCVKEKKLNFVGQCYES